VSDSKKSSTLYDISDDMSYGKYRNHTLRHFLARLKIYDEEQFPYKLYPIEL
jgi:hypothetical protein